MTARDEWRWTDEQGVQRLVGTDELRAALSSRVLPASTLVWREGMKEWVAASSLPELADVARAARTRSVPPGAPHRGASGRRDEGTPTKMAAVADRPKDANDPTPEPKPASPAAEGDDSAETDVPPKRSQMQTLVGLSAPESEPVNLPGAPIVVPPRDGARTGSRSSAITQAPYTGSDSTVPAIPGPPRVPSTSGERGPMQPHAATVRKVRTSEIDALWASPPADSSDAPPAIAEPAQAPKEPAQAIAQAASAPSGGSEKSTPAAGKVLGAQPKSPAIPRRLTPLGTPATMIQARTATPVTAVISPAAMAASAGEPVAAANPAPSTAMGAPAAEPAVAAKADSPAAMATPAAAPATAEPAAAAIPVVMGASAAEPVVAAKADSPAAMAAPAGEPVAAANPPAIAASPSAAAASPPVTAGAPIGEPSAAFKRPAAPPLPSAQPRTKTPAPVAAAKSRLPAPRSAVQAPTRQPAQEAARSGAAEAAKNPVTGEIQGPARPKKPQPPPALRKPEPFPMPVAPKPPAGAGDVLLLADRPEPPTITPAATAPSTAAGEADPPVHSPDETSPEAAPGKSEPHDEGAEDAAANAAPAHEAPPLAAAAGDTAETAAPERRPTSVEALPRPPAAPITAPLPVLKKPGAVPAEKVVLSVVPAPTDVVARLMETTPGQELPDIPTEPRRSRPAKQRPVLVPLSSLYGVGGFFVVALVLTFFVGRCSVEPAIARDQPTAQKGLARAPQMAKDALPPPPKPCWVARQPVMWAPQASKSIPFELAATAQGTIAVGYARDSDFGAGFEFDLASGTVKERFSQKTEKKIDRVAPVPGEALSFVISSIDTAAPSRSVVHVAATPPFVFVIDTSGVAVADAPDAAPTKLWPFEGGDAPSAPLALKAGDAGYVITLRRDNAVWSGWLGLDRKPIGALTKVMGSGGSVGKPNHGWNTKELAVVFADRPEGSPWQIRVGRGPKGAIPTETRVITVPKGGPGGDAFAPDIAGLSDGRWLLVWTEGATGSRAIRALTLAADLTPIGDPIALSPPAGNFGQGVLGIAGNYAATVFLSKGETNYELWGAILQCG